MKTRFTPRDHSSAGHALLIVLCITLASMIVLTATMNRTFGTATMNGRNNQYVAGLYAAEAATEKVYTMMKADFITGQLAAITNHIGLYQGAIPLASEATYWGNYQFSDGQGNLNSNYVACTMNAWQLMTNWGPIPSQYSGLYGWTNNWRIVSNAKQTANTTYNITNACQLEVALDLIPVFQFAIFYNSLLEFTWCAPMTVNGRTHANGDVYTGSAWQLTFNSLVTKTGSISSPAWDGHLTSDYTVATLFNAGYSTNALSLNLPIGTTNAHAIIEMPPTGEDPNSALGQARFYNKADVVLLVSNSTVTATIKTTATDPGTNITAYYYPTNLYASNYVQVTTNFPFLNITNIIYDQRETDYMKLTDIDVGKLNQWLVTNAAVTSKFPNTAGVYTLNNAPTILYVADNRSITAGTTNTAVRLKNAGTIPTNMVTIAGNNQPSGFTVSTPNPLYVWGNYNCPNSAYLNTTNTIVAGNATDYPASLVSDALTVLSGNWLDAQSATVLGSSKNKATSTTVNAAILTGNVPSTGSDAASFSGGVHNLPRLLEDWGSGATVTNTLNTSIVNLFASTRATNQFRAPGNYYQAPIRQYSFDPNFLNYTRQPPGTPSLSVVLRSRWVVPPPNSVTYRATKLIILFAASLASLPLRAQPASPASPAGPPANLATNQPLYVTQVKHVAGPDVFPADYAYVTFGTNKFGFVLPAGYRIETQDAQKVTLVSADYSCLLTFQVLEPLPPGITELDPAPYRSLLLEQRRDGKILEEFSLVANSRHGPAFDLSWSAPGPVSRRERVLLIPSDAGVLEFSLVSSLEKFDVGRRGFTALLSTFRTAGADGRLEMPVMSNRL